MGSMCNSSTKSKTTQTQTWGPTQYVADAYKGLINQAQGVAKTPYNPNTAQKVAGFTQPQYQGFAGVKNNQGAYQPFMDQAAGLATLGSSAITGDQIAGYMNTYQDQVIDASMNDWQRMAQRRMTDVNSNASKVGALTGDRSQVAQALAREASDSEMASGIAGLRKSGWDSALGAAQNDAGRALQGAQIEGSLGGLAQQYGYNDAQALLGIGQMQQDQNQKVFDANTLNAKTKSAYPFETTQWLANILQGIGSQAGGTSEGTGTTTQKSGGNILGKIIGTAATLYGMSDERVKRDIQEIGATHDGQPIYSYRFAGSPKTEIGLMAQEVEQRHPEAVAEIGGLKHVNYAEATRDAARPTYADGGEVGGLRNISYVPVSSMRAGGPMQPPQGPQAPAAQPEGESSGSSGMSSLLDSFQQAKSALGGEGGGATNGGAASQSGGLFSFLRSSTDPASGFTTTVNPSSASGWGNYLSNGMSGLSAGLSSLGGMFGFSHGGAVRGYADGGEVYDPFVQFGPTSAEAPQQPAQAGLAPLATQPPSPRPTASAAPPAAYKHILWDNGLGEDASNAVMLAGLGMLAGGGRDAFEDVGRGGLMGLQYYNQAKKQKQDESQGKLFEINGKLVRAMPDNSFQVVYDAGTQAKKTDDIVEYEYAKQNGFGGSFEQFMTQKRGTAAHQLPAELQVWDAYSKMPPDQQARFLEMKRGSDAQDKALAKTDVKRVENYQTDSDSAQSLLGDLNSLKAARAETEQEGPVMGRVMGFTDAGQRINSIAESVRLGFTSKTKGAISDSEMAMFGRATPGLLMSDDAAAPVIDGMQMASQRQIEKALFYDEWLRAKKSLQGADRAWTRFINEKPIISQGKDGKFALHPENVAAWRDYFDGGAAPAQAGGGNAGSADAALAEARDAIAKGASREKVIERLRAMGHDPKGL